MNPRIKEKTQTTPLISMDFREGILIIKGRSIPEDPEVFYEEVIDWIHEYFKEPVGNTQFRLYLEYANSGTSKYLMEILRIFKSYMDQGNACQVQWHYEEEDEAMYELGRHYQDAIDLPFQLKASYA
jgi:hypothetical protein